MPRRRLSVWVGSCLIVVALLAAAWQFHFRIHSEHRVTESPGHVELMRMSGMLSDIENGEYHTIEDWTVLARQEIRDSADKRSLLRAIQKGLDQGARSGQFYDCFNPGYAVSVTDTDSHVTTYLICLSCKQALVFGPLGNTMMHPFSAAPREVLAELSAGMVQAK